MGNGDKIVTCAPNFSEGTDIKKIDKIIDEFRGIEGIKLLDYSYNKKFNRSSAVIMGNPKDVKNAMMNAMGIALELIDMEKHTGDHPRVGAVDVVPFIPLKNMSMLEAIVLSKEFGKEASLNYNIPIFLYEKSASSPNRVDLYNIRMGGYEGIKNKLKRPEWKPDFGPDKPHPTGGISIVGARMPLVCFNIKFNTSNYALIKKIGKSIRGSERGFKCCRALAVKPSNDEAVVLAVVLTDYNKTGLYTVFEMVKRESEKFGVNIIGTEISGLVSMEALVNSAVYYLQLEDFSMEQVIEYKLME